MGSQKRSNLRSRKQLYLMMFAYSIMIIIFAVYSYTVLIKDLKSELGNKAMVLAVDITHWLDLDQPEYDRLLELDFNALLEDPLNRDFESKAREVMASSEIKYIYLLSELPGKKAKYKVAAGESKDFNASAGTSLTGVYTLDAVLNEDLRLEDTGGQGYTDKSRYTVLRPEVLEIMKKREPAFLLNTDEWGTYLTGYAPYFTEQGTFLGVVGVDLFPDKYYDYVKKSMTAFGLFLIILFLTGLFFSRLLTRMWKAEERVRLEHELSTQDALTGLINRRIFMGVLAHEYAVCRREGMPLTLVLADLEHFTQYNAEHGEAQGNRILKETAEFLSSRVQREADALCRFGGDEFAFFLHNTDGENALSFIEALLPASPFPIFMGVLSIMPEEDVNCEVLLDTLSNTIQQTVSTGSQKFVMIDET